MDDEVVGDEVVATIDREVVDRSNLGCFDG
jgi:hypothetical protein